MKFNENLKYLRKKEGLTQEQLAEKLNVSRQAVTKWESGQALPDIVNLKEIAVMFGVTTDELLGDEKSKNATTLDKKLKDLPLFLSAFAFIVLDFILSLQLQDMPLLLLAIIFIVIIPLTGIVIKKYLKNRPAIIDMMQTKEGKKARIKVILKDSIVFAVTWFIIDILIYIVRNYRGLEIYDSLIDILLKSVYYFIAFFIFDYIIVENKVKKYNK